MALSFGVTVMPDPPYGRLIELFQRAEEQGDLRQEEKICEALHLYVAFAPMSAAADSPAALPKTESAWVMSLGSSGESCKHREAEGGPQADHRREGERAQKIGREHGQRREDRGSRQGQADRARPLRHRVQPG